MRRFQLAGAIAFAAALTLASASDARPRFGPRGPHHRPGGLVEEHVKLLGLDEETGDAMQSIVDESRETGEQYHERLNEAHEVMRELLSQDTPDEGAVMGQAEAIGKLEVELHKHRLATMLRIRALLTPEQRNTMAELKHEFRGHWRHSLSEACEDDLDSVCESAEDRWSRMKCLRENRERLSEDCQEAIEAARGRGRRRGPGPRR